MTSEFDPPRLEKDGASPSLPDLLPAAPVVGAAQEVADIVSGAIPKDRFVKNRRMNVSGKVALGMVGGVGVLVLASIVYIASIGIEPILYPGDELGLLACMVVLFGTPLALYLGRMVYADEASHFVVTYHDTTVGDVINEHEVRKRLLASVDAHQQEMSSAGTGFVEQIQHDVDEEEERRTEAFVAKNPDLDGAFVVGRTTDWMVVGTVAVIALLVTLTGHAIGTATDPSMTFTDGAWSIPPRMLFNGAVLAALAWVGGAPVRASTYLDRRSGQALTEEEYRASYAERCTSPLSQSWVDSAPTRPSTPLEVVFGIVAVPFMIIATILDEWI